jgi:eukaryotic-like serine/threonine-protein kinase
LSFLPDRVFEHLRDVTDLPDLSGTRYRLERELGRGGMGVVYEVLDQQLNRRVALKVLAVAASGQLLEEARVVAQLEHPGVVPVFDVGRLPDDRLYYTMKLVGGTRLDAYAQGSAPLSDRLRIFQKICEAVAFAHSRGIIHRDLKPANIMVGQFGEVIVMDWGIGVAGTPRYRAPEQTIGPPADIYSLGAVLRSLLPNPAPLPLAAVIRKATAQDPAQRYPDATSLNLEIGRFLDGFAVQAYRESPLERATRFYRKNQPLLVLLLIYMVVRFVLFFWSRV